MKNLQNRSIKDKLKYLIRLSVLLMLLVSGGVLMINTVISNKQALRHELNALTEVTTLAITPALVFENPNDAKNILQTLKAHKNIVYAVLTKKDKTAPFAVYTKKDYLLDSLPRELTEKCLPERISLRFMQICKPIILDNEEYGQIILIVSLDSMYQRLLKEMAIALLGLAVVAWLISRFAGRVAKQITDPILELVSTSQNIEKTGDYRQRVKFITNDEIGQLGTAFNNMLLCT